MPKGKPKAKNPDLYEDEDSEEAQERSKAPQAVAHARGGRWEVKDHLKTGTHWDDMHHVDLKRAAENAGLYTKDMGKVAMIHALAKKDRIDEMEERAAERERRRKRMIIAIRERKKQAQRVMKKRDRQRRRDEGEDYVSDTTESESDGVNDETDQESYTPSTTPTTPSFSFVYPAQRLRIYEWPYNARTPPTDPPATPPTNSPLNPTQTPVSPWSAHDDEINPELLPKPLPYAVMKLVTTISKEKLDLPGRQYPDEVDPDFVPPLSEHTKDCARNGVLYGQLQQAVIERGADWAERTIVQWWNGRMFLNLPPRGASKKTLADVYAKWKKKEQRTLKQEKGKGRGIQKTEPKRRVAQRLLDQRQKMLDIYAVSEYRPTICYMPSYLDFPHMDDDEDVEKSMDNLFYIRFADEDLPHYYFWAVSGEWEDPTQPNPEWVDSGMEGVPYQAINTGRGVIAEHHDGHGGHAGIPLHSTSDITGLSSRTVLVKRTPVPRKFRPSSVPPKTSKYKAALWIFEKDLFNKGWGLVMKEARERWAQEGKVQEWLHLTRHLPILYPAGRLPTSPPVNPPKVRSLAEKLAAVEVSSELRPIESILGDEPWTRDDEAYWEIVNLPPGTEGNEDALLHPMNSPATPYALERRISEEMPMVTSWISNIPPSTYSPSVPPSRRASTPSTFSTLNLRQRQRMIWEERFLENFETDTLLSTTIEQMPVAELKHNLYLMMKKTLASRHHHQGQFDHRCEICLQELDRRRSSSVQRHFQQHELEAIDQCPFCGAEWNKWPSEAKASHVFFHHSYQEQRAENDGRRRRSSTLSNDLNVLYAIPRSHTRSSMKSKKERTENTTPSTNTKRKTSKVSFSPVTVERRIAYNDAGNNYDADVSSITTLSPKRSSLKRPSIEASPQKTPSTSGLRIDTNVNASPKTTRGMHRGMKRTAAAAVEYDDSEGTPAVESTESSGSLKRRILTKAKSARRPSQSSNTQNTDTDTDSNLLPPKKIKTPVSLERIISEANSEASHLKEATGQKRKRSLNDASVGDSQTSLVKEVSARTGSPQGKPPKIRRLDTQGSSKSQASSPSKTNTTSGKRGKAPKVSSRPSTSKTSRKSKSPKEVALEAKKSAATKALAARRASKQKTKPKTTLLGRPHVEPLVLAPARRWGKKSTGGLTDILSPPTPPEDPQKGDTTTSNHLVVVDAEDPDLSDDQLTDTLRRGRRSSAPTPSPSLSSSHRTSSLSTLYTNNPSPTPIDPVTPPNQTKPRKASQTKKPTSTIPLDTEKTKRKPSYDVPHSEPCFIVPPNTPANRLAKKQKKRRARKSISSHPDSDVSALDITGPLSQRLDIAELSDKTKEVENKTKKTAAAGRGTRGKGGGDGVKKTVKSTSASTEKGRPRKSEVEKKAAGGGKKAASCRPTPPQPTRKSARIAANAKAAVPVPTVERKTGRGGRRRR